MQVLTIGKHTSWVRGVSQTITRDPARAFVHEHISVACLHRSKSPFNSSVMASSRLSR
jgi:hypothetical protein